MCDKLRLVRNVVTLIQTAACFACSAVQHYKLALQGYSATLADARSRHIGVFATSAEPVCRTPEQQRILTNISDRSEVREAIPAACRPIVALAKT